MIKSLGPVHLVQNQLPLKKFNFKILEFLTQQKSNQTKVSSIGSITKHTETFYMQLQCIEEQSKPIISNLNSMLSLNN